MTIVEFAENVAGMKLLDCQKKNLEEMYERYKRGGKLYYNPRGRVIEMNYIHILTIMYFIMSEKED